VNSLLFLLATRVLLTLWLLNLFPLVSMGWSGEAGGYRDAASLKGFADTLFLEGHYYPAMMEYERFCYFHPHHPEKPRAQFNSARAMKITGDYPSALAIFTALAFDSQNGALTIEASFERAEVLFLMEEYPSALTQYEAFLTGYPDHPLAERARSAIKKLYQVTH